MATSAPDLNEVRDPWERQPGESRQAFEAFTLYRDMGLKRSIRAVAAALGKSATLLSRWSSRWQWPARAEAWDAVKDEEARIAQLEAVREMNKRHASLGFGLISVAGMRLRQLSEAVQAGAAGAVGPQDVVRMAVEGARLERLAIGLPTEITQRREPTEDNEWAELTDDDLRALVAREAASGAGV